MEHQSELHSACHGRNRDDLFFPIVGAVEQIDIELRPGRFPLCVELPEVKDRRVFPTESLAAMGETKKVDVVRLDAVQMQFKLP